MHPKTVFALLNNDFNKKAFLFKSLKLKADFKSTCCINIHTNLYSLLKTLQVVPTDVMSDADINSICRGNAPNRRYLVP